MKEVQDYSVIPAEILFAQHLAANEKKIRDRALRKLQRYLVKRASHPSGGFDEPEFLKIWKGLHYCMWMQDKPLIHEELTEGICNLVHCFPNIKNALLYIKTFYMTECREWSSIDKWRMDKFLMLFRGMLNAAFQYLKKQKWLEKPVNEFLDFLETYILTDHAHERCPDGVRFHLADIFLTELERVSSTELGPKQSVRFLQPWVNMLAGLKNITLRAYVVKNIFGKLIEESPAFTGRPRQKNSKKLRVNYRLLADMLMKTGSSEQCKSMNQAAIYSLVNNFKALSEGKLPYDPDEQIVSDIEDLNEDDIENAIERLAKFDKELMAESEKLKPTKRKRKPDFNGEIEDRNHGEEDDFLADSGDDLDEYDSDGSLVAEEEDDDTSEQEYQPPKKVKKSSQVPCKKEAPMKKHPKAEKKKIYSKKLNQLLQAEKAYMNENLESAAELDGEMEEEADPSYELNGATDVKIAPNLLENGKANKKNKRKAKTQAKDDLDETSTDSSASKERNGLAAEGSASDEPTNSLTGDAAPAKGKRKNKLSKPAASTEQTDKAKDMKSMSEKKSDKLCNGSTSDFDMESFPSTDGEVNMSSLISMTGTESQTLFTSNKKSKKNKAKPTAIPPLTPKGSSTLADFTSSSTTKVSAKYFKKAMSKSGTPQTSVTSLSVKTSSEKVVKSDKKRISFGQSQSVKKTDVKIKGRLSFDPNKTPEQGILKVNPITPGTVIQVGKQATMMNTLKNSKFPGRMLASDFF